MWLVKEGLKSRELDPIIINVERNNVEYRSKVVVDSNKRVKQNGAEKEIQSDGMERNNLDM